MIWFFVWWKVVKSEPEDDPNISPEELKYIHDSLGNAPHKVHLADTVDGRSSNMLTTTMLQ
jgi:uncharacterized protein YneF (UPF0154 family)